MENPNDNQRIGGWRTQRNEEEEEFQESDVWELNQTVQRAGSSSFDLNGNAVDTANNHKPDLWDLNTNLITTTEQKRQRPTGLLSRRLASVMISVPGTRKEDTQTAGNDQEEPATKLVHSAPVNVPDWSKIYGRRPRKKGSDLGDGSGVGFDDDESEEDDDEDDGEEEEYRRRRLVLPPHEWLAKKEMGRSKTMSPSSVSEGLGRTLKGRDLTRVRNAVLTRTGFL